MTYIVPENNVPADPFVLLSQMNRVEDDDIDQVQSQSCPQDGNTEHGTDDERNGEYKRSEHIQQGLIDLFNILG